MGVLIVGCSGSGTSLAPGGSPGTTQTFGPLMTRLVGAAQAPVTSSAANGANATALAGALVDQLTLNLQGPGTLSETKLAFVSDRTGNPEIYSMNADGTGQTKLTNNPAFDESPAWSPDGTKIAFMSDRTGTYDIYIYTMSPDGKNLTTRLTTNAADDFTPSWSPDGTQIVFSSFRDGNSEIYSMNADGTGQTRLTNNVANDNFPSWSPDSTKIAFVSDRDGNYEIYTINADGSHPRRLTNNVANDNFPSWSPDSTKIAFSSDRDGFPEIYSMNAYGTGQTRLTNNEWPDDHPSWSPDGTKITFSSNRDGNYEIYSMPSYGGTAINLSKKYSVSDFSPSWSGYFPRTPKTLIGSAAGTLGTAAAGFLFGQKGKQITSIVAFDTLTAASRTGARVVNQTATETQGNNLIFSITTSAGLSSINYTDINEAGVPGGAISPVLPAGTTGALVSFDAYDGTVTSIVAYAANRSVSTPTRSGNHATYTGGFSAIFDGAGKNLAPQGAKSITLDEMTGKLVSFK